MLGTEPKRRGRCCRREALWDNRPSRASSSQVLISALVTPSIVLSLQMPSLSFVKTVFLPPISSPQPDRLGFRRLRAVSGESWIRFHVWSTLPSHSLRRVYTYAWFPLMAPKAMDGILTELDQEDKYAWNHPQRSRVQGVQRRIRDSRKQGQQVQASITEQGLQGRPRSGVLPCHRRSRRGEREQAGVQGIGGDPGTSGRHHPNYSTTTPRL